MRPETATLAGEFTACMLQQGHYNPDQPRAPQGTTIGGRWVAADQTAQQAPRRPRPTTGQLPLDFEHPPVATVDAADAARARMTEACLPLLQEQNRLEALHDFAYLEAGHASDALTAALDRAPWLPGYSGRVDTPEVLAARKAFTEASVKSWSAFIAASRAKQAVQRAALDSLAARSPAKLTLDAQDPAVVETAQDGLALFNRMVDTDALAGLATAPVSFENRTRDNRSAFVPYAGANGMISLHTSASETATAHEVAHWAEQNVPGLRAYSQRWIDGRTAGEVAQSLADLLPDSGYDRREITKPDHFSHPYIGRIYPDGATEALSMGMQSMIEDPIGFAAKDLDHWRFTYKFMSGAWREGQT